MCWELRQSHVWCISWRALSCLPWSGVALAVCLESGLGVMPLSEESEPPHSFSLCVISPTAHSLLFDFNVHIRQLVPWQPQGLNSSVKSLSTHMPPSPSLHTPSLSLSCSASSHTHKLRKTEGETHRHRERGRSVWCLTKANLSRA